MTTLRQTSRQISWWGFVVAVATMQRRAADISVARVAALKGVASLLFAILTTASAAQTLPSVLDTNVTQVAVGGAHTCALTTQGGVKCWGSNNFGQLGVGSGGVRFIPTDVSGLTSGVIQITAGDRHTCALAVSGGVKCWGDNSDGQLGDNTTSDRFAPVDVINLASGVVQIAAGSLHTCALTRAGGVKCWGNNDLGRLGDGSTTQRLTPVDVTGLSSGATQIAVGEAHACALTTMGGAKCWGYNIFGQLGDGTNTARLTPVNVNGLTSGVAQIVGGARHSCALTARGGVKCWGSNAHGQVGDNGSMLTFRLTPVDVIGLASGVAQLSVSFFHSCALAISGGVKCWGDNTRGQVGDNSTTDRLTPVDVSGLASGVAQIAAGWDHTCALTATGGIKCWGWNNAGQLGDRTTTQKLTPVDVAGFASGVAQLSAGGTSTCALSSARGAKCWGDNAYGQLGDNSLVQRFMPVDVQGLANGVIQIAAHDFNACAIDRFGGAWCWGRNDFGQLGYGVITAPQETPQQVTGFANSVAQIAVGGFHACALTTAGGVKCWGRNQYGQLGDDTTTTSLVPVNVSGLSNGVAQITAGRHHTCAVMTDGVSKCWGANDSGQLGDNSINAQSKPVNVAGLASDVSQIMAGDVHTCAISGASSAGVVKCWGDNSFGQLGDNSNVQRLVPVNVVNLDSGVTKIAAGGSHTCAITKSSGIACWGDNFFGQLGDNSTTQRLTPVDVSGLASGVDQITTGSSHTCALTAAGVVKCWGNNGFGRLGDNTNTQRLIPVDIRAGQLLSVASPSSLVLATPVNLSANSTSALAPTFDTWTPSTCSVGASGTVTAAATALCGIRVSQAGNNNIVAASQKLVLLRALASPPVLNLDDSDAADGYSPTTDALLLMRYLFGFRGNALTANALGANARRDATQIEAHIAANLPLFDVDGDGATLATTDAVLIVRRLLGLSGAALTAGVRNGSRSDGDIANAIDALRP